MGTTLSYPSRTAMVRNILREYRATDGRTGRTWYADANALAAEIADESRDFNWVQVAGVIAALSPQTQWWQNVMLARQAVSVGAMIQGHTGDAMRKVNRILALEDRTVSNVLAILGGTKVRSFFQNIVTAGGLDGIVTIDRHAWRTVCGGHELATRNSVPGTGYKLAQDAYIRAAEIVSKAEGLHITAAQLQAVVWVPRAA